MEVEKKRKVTLPQLDEIWKAAKDQWGDPGLRHPAPDPRFETLRHLLNDIEGLFGDESRASVDDFSLGTSVSAKKRPLKKSYSGPGSRKIMSDDDDEEIPF